MKHITIIIPCYNEEKSIASVINSIPKAKLKHLGYSHEVLVIDNNSTDKTSALAKKLGARVIHESKKGKGNAMRTGFSKISKDTDYIIMLDGDNTYKPEEIPRMIEPLENNFCDVIVGSRLEGRMRGHAMSFSHRLANWFFTFIVRFFYQANVTDTCTGYFAWKKEAINKLNGHLVSDGFALEAEMITKMAKLGLKIYSVPITFDPRHAQTSSNLSPLMDGIKITWMLLRNIGWKPGK